MEAEKMFQKKQKQKTKEVQKVPEPQEIEELKEAVEGDEETPQEDLKEIPEEEVIEEDPKKVDGELTEEAVKNWMKNVAIVINEQERRIANIEHHLRIDFG